MKGPVDVQRMFLQEITKEAKKWKRKGLLEQLEKRAANLLPAKETDEPPKKVGVLMHACVFVCACLCVCVLFT